MSTLIRCAALAVVALSLACSDDSDGGPAAAAGSSGTGGSGGSGRGGAGGSGGSGGAPAGGVTFTDDIHPILLAKCGGSQCHDGSNAPTLPGHAAEDVEEAYEATQELSSLDNQPVYERILERISTTEAGFMMPPSFANPPCNGTIGSPGCISQAELDLIEEWIEAGTPL